MIRCAILELFFPGCGYALLGHLRLAAIVCAAALLVYVSAMFTPWALWLAIAVRLAVAIDGGRRGRRGAPAGGWRWKPMLLVASVALGGALMTRMVAVELFKIPSVSMAPTLALDDVIAVDKLSIHWRAPERGEIVAFTNVGRTWVKRVAAVGGDEVAVRDGILVVNGAPVPRREVGPTRYRNRDEPSGATDYYDDAIEYEERHGGRVYRVYGAPDGDASMHDYPRAELGGRGCDASIPRGADSVPLTPTTSGACRVPPGTVFLLGDNRDNSNDSRYWGAMPVERVFGRVVGVWIGGEPGHRLGRIGGV